MPYTIRDFTKEYHEIKEEVPSYRMGQHWINKFISKSDTLEMQQLWNEWCDTIAITTIYDIIEKYNWDCYDLPLLEDN